MKHLISLILFFTFFIISCSSDPCEEITCVNGACNDGSCLCEDGYLGSSCDEIDIVGTFFLSSVRSDPNTNCSQQYLDYNPQLKGEALCDDLGCSTLSYTFNSDMTIIRTVIEYEEDANGNLIEGFKFNREGTYEVSGNSVIINTPLETDFEFQYESNQISYYRSFWQDCFATRTFTKRQ